MGNEPVKTSISYAHQRRHLCTAGHAGDIHAIFVDFVLLFRLNTASIPSPMRTPIPRIAGVVRAIQIRRCFPASAASSTGALLLGLTQTRILRLIGLFNRHVHLKLSSASL